MAWYRSGTVALTNGSTTVTGSGTAFNANVSIGEGFYGPDGRLYEIANVVSDTVLTLASAYLGGNGSGQPYFIAPLRGLDRTNATLLAELINSFASVRDGIGAGLFPDGTVSLPALRFSADQDTGLRRIGSNALSVVTGGADRLIVNGANVGIGTNSPSFNLDVTGTQRVSGSASFDTDIFLRAATTNFIYYKDTLSFAQSGVGDALRIVATSRNVTPGFDNAQSLGISGIRWSVVFAGTGTINTSDAREKVWRGAPDDAALRAANRIIGELGFFQWTDAVEEKGEDGARIHFGVRAQQVIRIMMEEGLEAEQKIDFALGVFIPAKDRPSFRHAFLCFDTGGDEYRDEVIEKDVEVQVPGSLLDADGNPIMVTRVEKGQVATGRKVLIQAAYNRFGLRIDQLTMFLLAALASRVAALEGAA